MSNHNPLDSIFFLNLPKDIRLSENNLEIDYSIPLPVQKKSITQENIDISELTTEMIFAGILTVLAYDTHNEHTEYYRRLILAARPDIKKELTEAAILKARNEDFDIAEEIFDALRGIDPEDVVTILNTAIFFDQRGESYRKSGLEEDADAYDESAFRYYKQAMEAETPPPDVFFNSAFFFLRQKNYVKAKSSFETYLSLTSNLSEDDMDENQKYKIERAKEILRDINSRNLEDEQFKSAFELISMGKEEQGLEEIREFLSKNPTVWNAWFILGWGLRRLERWNDAKLAFEKSIECGSTEPDTLNELAICHLELGEFKESRECLVAALSLEPENTKIMSNMGYLELKMGNKEEAKKYFLTVLEFDPNDVIASNMLSQL